YQGLEYTDVDIADFEERLERIYSRETHWVQVVNFQGMAELMRDGFFTRMVMEHRDDASKARRRLSLRQFILALGLHTGEEMESLGFARRFATGRKSKAHISGGQFVARLAKHFGLLTAEILGGLIVIAPELLIIDMAKLVRLQICEQLDDTWAWVAMGPERQPDAASGALGVAQDAPVIDEGGQADSAPVQEPPPPPATARTMQ
ncbi:hypothetical protein Tco_0619653, partial [Tanacetum coccineum]